MATLTLESVNFHYASPYAPVFEDLSLTIDTHWKTGLVGRNGRGKTTLMQLIHQNLKPVQGQINIPLKTCYFPYTPPHENQQTLAVIKNSIAPFTLWERQMQKLLNSGDEASLNTYGDLAERYETMHGYQIDDLIEKEFAHLGMDSALLRRDFRTLSGGERTRGLIVSLFLRQHHFPLIDEPTNHLDMAGRTLLGEYLARKKTLFVCDHQ